MPVIDIHAHLIPKDAVDAARTGDGIDGLSVTTENGIDLIRHRQGYVYPFTPEFHDPTARLRAMDALGIDAAIVSISPTFFFSWIDAPTAAAFARTANDSIAAHVAAAPNRLAGLATLPMQDGPAAARELERAVTELGLRGASVGLTVDGDFLDAERFWPVLEAAEALDVALLLHPSYVGLRPGLRDFYLTNLVGNPLETAIGASRLILSGVLDRFPRLRLALVHGGGFLPYQIGRLDRGYRVRPESKGCAAPPSTYLRRFVFDTVTHRPEVTAFLASLVGPDRVAFGTDLPFDMMAGSFDEQVPPSVDGDARRAIASETARAWFGVFGAPVSAPGPVVPSQSTGGSA